MSRYLEVQDGLRSSPRRWLVTGVAGFIGSNLLQRLLQLDQEVWGLDNLSTGHRRNLEEVKSLVTPEQWGRFNFQNADICDAQACEQACRGVDVVLHQAALGSVPRSIEDPAATHRNNVTGFAQILIAAHKSGVGRFVYASSSSVYGNEPGIPKVEERVGVPLSPYAASKAMNEMYAATFAEAYGFRSIGLRYFNVFGARQDPCGPYAAVIPRWIAALLDAEPILINGDGKTSRDFCYVENVVQANLLAATTQSREATNQVYNIALGEQTTLLELLELISRLVSQGGPARPEPRVIFRDFRAGDVRHSVASIAKARDRLGYSPTHRLEAGLTEAMPWYRRERTGKDIN